MKKQAAVILACLIISASALSGCQQSANLDQTVPTQASVVESTESNESTHSTASDTGVSSESSAVDDSASAVSQTSEKSVPDTESSQPSTQESSKQEESSKEESSKQETSHQETSKPTETSKQESSHQESSKPTETSKQESSKEESSKPTEASKQESSTPTPTPTPTPTVTKLTLDVSSITLTEGGSQELNAYVYFSDGSRTYQGISWQTSNNSIATVSSSGVVTAKAKGTATITATYTYKNQTYNQSCKVTVNAKPQEQVTVSAISISNSSVTLTEGGTQTISAYAVMSNGSTKSVSWQSSNQSIASISNGTITAKSAGTATITASYGGKSASCQVTVKKKEQVAQATVQYIDITDSSITIDAKKTYTLTVNAVMSDGSTKRLTNGEVLWEVVDTSIATVSNGVITGVSGGQTTVFATYKGNKVDKCTIYVNATYQQPQHPEWVPSDHYKVYSSGGYEMYEVPELTEYLNKYRRQVGASDLRWCGPDRSAANIKACEEWYNSLSDSDKAVYQRSCPEAFSEDGKIDVLKFMWSMTCESVCDSVEYCIVHRTLAHGNDYGSSYSNINSGQGYYYDPEAWVLHISESAPHWGIAMNKDADTVYAVCYRYPDGDFLLCILIG